MVVPLCLKPLGKLWGPLGVPLLLLPLMGLVLVSVALGGMAPLALSPSQDADVLEQPFLRTA